MSSEAVCVLGATGSIGLSTLDVCAQHPEKFSIFALSAHSDWRALLKLCLVHKPKYAVISSEQVRADAVEAFKNASTDTELLFGADALTFIASHNEVDIVMAAIVGAAGLSSSFAAAQSGKKLLLANKESLVLAGSLLMNAVRESNGVLLPIDSEHNAIFQCLPHNYACGNKPGSEVTQILLTASGGPFRSFNRHQLELVTPEQACTHPNWSMGRKISVDSASLMNKGLELIEACWLFDVSNADIEVVVHPQSIVHSMVRYGDGSVLAQMGEPDMRTPISYGLSWPHRIECGVKPLDLTEIATLHFEKPNSDLFPCLNLAREAFDAGGYASAYLNAANEVAVDAFLKGKVRFVDIPDIIANAMSRAPKTEVGTITDIFSADKDARSLAESFIETQALV
ncbi:1-deoxy-D-xylulose-5-phosphate reductoisomerase [Oleiphilus sp. HI0125]|uniref:1-deoxy-D-xylulose-5-phosphate reductoisomerase n=2 Tax=Oleiphilus sp. HI0125 TaxID=1822266 RepID=UPI0007C409D5|nr:1-deoxy-D-xylulose-5-phosphate reductoisomerase [Oleiphilus sp. HI0125]KZZ61718.1 1-deoxy-D-xylulose-5-phosphate reductoisomerase [Oleiphilus sp. HI0125]